MQETFFALNLILHQVLHKKHNLGYHLTVVESAWTVIEATTAIYAKYN